MHQVYGVGFGVKVLDLGLGFRSRAPQFGSRSWGWVSEHPTRECVHDLPPSRKLDFGFGVLGQLSSDLGTYTTVRARFWPLLEPCSDKVREIFLSCSPLTQQRFTLDFTRSNC